MRLDAENNLFLKIIYPTYNHINKASEENHTGFRKTKISSPYSHKHGELIDVFPTATPLDTQLLLNQILQLLSAAVFCAINGVVALIERITPVGLAAARVKVACFLKVNY